MVVTKEVCLIVIVLCRAVYSFNGYNTIHEPARRPRHMNDYEPPTPPTSNPYWDTDNVYNNPINYDRNFDPRRDYQEWPPTIDSPPLAIHDGRHRYRTLPVAGYYYPVDRNPEENEYLQPRRRPTPAFENGYPMDGRRYLHPHQENNPYEVHPMYQEIEPEHMYLEPPPPPRYPHNVDRLGEFEKQMYEESYLERQGKMLEEEYHLRYGHYIQERSLEHAKVESNLDSAPAVEKAIDNSTVTKPESEIVSTDNSALNTSSGELDGHMRVIRRVVLSLDDDEADVEVED